MAGESPGRIQRAKEWCRLFDEIVGFLVWEAPLIIGVVLIVRLAHRLFGDSDHD